jgi:uroporphyrinogen-III decarboxylase
VIWQPDNVTSDMTPPAAFREFCIPFYRKHTDEMESAGKPYVVHMDGKVGVLREEIQKSGFDVLESVSIPDMGGDLEIAEAQAALPDTVILPNFPSNWATLESGDIRSKVMNLLKTLDPKRGVMLQISEDIPADHERRVYPVIAEAVAEYNEL